jgi:hypothetical protein
VNRAGKIAMKFEGENEGMKLINARIASPEDDVMLVTALGRAIRFPSTDVRVFNSRASVGVLGIRLKEGDTVVSMSIIRHFDATAEERAGYLKMRRAMAGLADDAEVEADDDEDAVAGAISTERYAQMSAAENLVLTITAKGSGKLSSSHDYPVRSRGGQASSRWTKQCAAGRWCRPFRWTSAIRSCWSPPQASRSGSRSRAYRSGLGALAGSRCSTRPRAKSWSAWPGSPKPTWTTPGPQAGSPADMRLISLAICALTWPMSAGAQSLDGADATLQFGALTGDATETPFRLHGDALIGFGRGGVQLGATYGAEDLADLDVIGFVGLGSRWRIGAEVETSSDPAFEGADLIWGLRLRYSDAGGTVDTRGGLVSGGPDGAFFVTVALDQQLGADTAVRGLLHRYSVNDESNDFFAIGVGADKALSENWTVYADGIWSLSDDYLTETTGGTLGLRRHLGGNHTAFAGVTAYSLNGDTYAGLTAGLTVRLDRPGSDKMFDTDPWQMQLAQIGH